jgi:opacity protein-like surface antigen
MHALVSLKSPHNFLLSLFVFTILIFTSQGFAQSLPAASKSADISIFGAFTYGSPDYGDAHDFGGTVGANFTRYFRWKVAPSFEIRANRVNGTVMDQESAFGGLRGQMEFSRFHPYANVLYGDSKIFFHFPPSPTYTMDTATGWSVGGGVDIDAIRHFQVKIDYQNEFFNYGRNGTLPGNAEFTLSPTRFSVGVTYRIPIRPHTKQANNH